MRLLVETHILLWSAQNPERLPGTVQKALLSPQNTLYFSILSLWEIATKKRIGKLTLEEGFTESLPASDYHMLDLTLAHIEHYESLPLHHRDPFDRMLIAQSQVENLTLMSHDKTLQPYGINLLPWN